MNNEEYGRAVRVVLAEVVEEMRRQNELYPEAYNRHSLSDWLLILGEEYGEVCREAIGLRWSEEGSDLGRAREELIQCAAVAIQATVGIAE